MRPSQQRCFGRTRRLSAAVISAQQPRDSNGMDLCPPETAAEQDVRTEDRRVQQGEYSPCPEQYSEHRDRGGAASPHGVMTFAEVYRGCKPQDQELCFPLYSYSRGLHITDGWQVSFRWGGNAYEWRREFNVRTRYEERVISGCWQRSSEI